MFKKILIANRGEIACRVIKTARKMGIKTVAVYSDADRDALHVEMADEAVHIGPPAAAQSYLVIDKIVDACKADRRRGRASGLRLPVRARGLPDRAGQGRHRLHRPEPRGHRRHGRQDRDRRRRPPRAKVSTVPGYLGEIADAKQAVKIAAEIGYPVMIKASAGGGGKGMRIAYDAKECEEGFGLARSEAKSSFGDDRVFIEKFIDEPAPHRDPGARRQARQRHLSGRARMLDPAPQPEGRSRRRPRRCSTRRRARAMGEQAVALAKAVGYDCAGTVEFVAGQDRSFFFLEMNTRLQVEHPVTELVTGIDLVEQMIRVAAGEKLAVQAGRREAQRLGGREPHLRRGPLSQLPALDRPAGEVPPAGAKARIDGVTVRNDTGVAEGGEISMFYDPMIAKLVTHAPTRAAGDRRAGRGARRLPHRRHPAQHPVPDRR